ncbi:retrotransposon protein, putative, ty1-copia subclass [Tanacetum coccineum]
MGLENRILLICYIGGTGLKYHPLENDKDLYKLMDSGQFAAKLFVNGGTPFIRNTGHDEEESITHKVEKAHDQMCVEHALLYCKFGGKFKFHPLRNAMCYCGTTRIEELVIYRGTTLTHLKLLEAKLFSLSHETVTLQYRVPFQGCIYAAIEDDKDIDKMIQSCYKTVLEVFVSGTPVDMKTRYVVPTGRVKVPAGRYVVPTGKDNVIVSVGRSKGNGKNMLAYAPKAQIPPPPPIREDPATDSIVMSLVVRRAFEEETVSHLSQGMVFVDIDWSNSYTKKFLYITVSNKRAITRTGLYSLVALSSWTNQKETPQLKRVFGGSSQGYGLYNRTHSLTSQHNGVSERRNRPLLDMVLSLMSKSTLPSLFGIMLLRTAARLLNMALVKRDTLTKPDKLEPRFEIIQEEDTHPSIDTSLNHEEDDLEIDEPQSDIIPIRRSTRTRRPTDRMCLYIDAEEHELGDLGEPANYKAALLDPESDKWLNAMNVEMQSMKDNEVWVLGWNFLLNGQNVRIDYEETFSPVVDIRAIRILIAIAAYYDYEIWQMDVKIRLPH